MLSSKKNRPFDPSCSVQLPFHVLCGMTVSNDETTSEKSYVTSSLGAILIRGRRVRKGGVGRRPVRKRAIFFIYTT